MTGSFPSKRYFPAVTSAATTNGSQTRFKRYRTSGPPPLTVPTGNVAFRLLCHASLVGGFIGKSGAAIKALQQLTGAKIRVDDATRGCDDRVIIVIASSDLTDTLSLSSEKVEGDEMEVSPAQKALVRVFESVLGVETELPSEGPVICKLLVDESQVGSVIGKGGAIVEKMRTDTGCKIRVLRGEKLPSCAGMDDGLVEIEGANLAVMKALVLISRRLQDFPLVDNRKLPRNNFFEASPKEYPKHSSLETGRASIPNSGSIHKEVIFKMLCPNDRIGGVIGMGGSIVRSLQNETGASINVAPSEDMHDERLITIMASENLRSRHSSAQDALCLVFARSVDAGLENGLEDSSASNSLPVVARLVVPSNQIGCLLGKRGAIISEMRRATGTGIQIIKTDQIPNCGYENDVVQISGELLNVQDAIYHVTDRLLGNFLGSSTSHSEGGNGHSSSLMKVGVTSPYERERDVDTSFPSSHPFNPYSSLIRNLDDNISPYNFDYPPSSSYIPSQMYSMGVAGGGSAIGSFNGGMALGRSKSAMVSHTTVEIVVAENAIGSVYGENGSNLARLRQISGAKVVVHEPQNGSGDRIVVISGTPSQTQAAQTLLHAFILTHH